PGASSALEDTTAKGKRYERYWGRSESGVHRISRPIVVDGLERAVVRIELAPRIRLVDDELVDDSYRAVEHAATQFFRSLNLPQLVMATVALQVHMRKNRQHIEAKKQLQQRWTDLARRMKRLRVQDEHLLLDEQRLRERLDALASAPPDDGRVQLLRI